MKPKITREDIIQEIRQQREDFSKRMIDEANGVQVYDLTTPEGRQRFLVDNSYILLPTPFEPVLAKIHHNGENGVTEWYEVVYYNGTEWCCYAGSETFKDGERILKWKYCNEIL